MRSNVKPKHWTGPPTSREDAKPQPVAESPEPETKAKSKPRGRAKTK